MAHAHAHSAAGANKKRLAIVFGLTTAYPIAEVVGGLMTGSLALLADAGHMLTDVAGLGLALMAIKFAERPATPERTYGYYRARSSRRSRTRSCSSESRSTSCTKRGSGFAIHPPRRDHQELPERARHRADREGRLAGVRGPSLGG